MIKKLKIKILLSVLFIFSYSFLLIAQQDTLLNNNLSLHPQEKKGKEKKEREKIDQPVQIAYAGIFASVETSIRFEAKNYILSAKIDLEKNLGLQSSMYLASGSFLYRITPRSGIFASYYGLKRESSIETAKEIVFLDDTIPAGSYISGFFNTYIFSAGYLFSILKDPDAFLAAYINIYFMKIKTGVRSNIIDLDDKVEFVAPLPNFGLLGSFRITPWLTFKGGIGLLFFNTENYSGSIHDMHLGFSFKPTRWLGLDAGYQVFDVRVTFPSENIRTHIIYNIKGPSLGVSLNF